MFIYFFKKIKYIQKLRVVNSNFIFIQYKWNKEKNLV